MTEGKMKKEISIIGMIAILSFLLITLPCKAEAAPWTCPSDDEANGIYWICNYFPLIPENQWQYTTGEYHIEDDVRTCSSGYSGILLDTDTYEYSSYLQNGIDGLLFAGCQYDEGDFEDGGTHFVVVPPSISIGEVVRILTDERGTMDVEFVALETITVPAGTFSTLKMQWTRQANAGGCSYKTTLWLTKGIGPVKMHRTDANPADCLGCMFVCDPDNDVIKLNTPAELISFEIDGINKGPDLTGTWTSMSQTFKNTSKGSKCKIKGKVTIQNTGNEDAPTSVVRFYLSNDNIFDGGDSFLKNVSTGKIKVDKSKTKTLSYTFDVGTSLTDKYIITVLDSDNQVTEFDETNNNIVYGPLQ
jgi:hypothetical protein